MKAMEWYFPKSREELAELLKEEGILIHAGGTAIKEERIKSAKRVIDISSLPLNYIKKEGDIWRIGATATLGQVMDALESDHLLVKALKCTATTPLRNRITMGGSVYLSPLWSNLMGPLLALEAEIEVLGRRQGTCKYEEFLSNRGKFQGCAVTEVRLPDVKLIGCFDRFARTATDYSALTVTIALSVKGESIRDAKVVVTGSKRVYDRLSGVEKALQGSRLEDVDAEGILRNVNVEFADKPAGSGAYLAEVSKVLLCRGLNALGSAR
ncbi:MAG: FAD binding domain-containing protein [Acetomicrobium sp.]|nr:FAD binding domain-containing protein [Acetomicrobium sp.]